MYCCALNEVYGRIRIAGFGLIEMAWNVLEFTRFFFAGQTDVFNCDTFEVMRARLISRCDVFNRDIFVVISRGGDQGRDSVQRA